MMRCQLWNKILIIIVFVYHVVSKGAKIYAETMLIIQLGMMFAFENTWLSIT